MKMPCALHRAFCLQNLLFDEFSGNFQLVGGHQCPELAVLLMTGNLLSGAVIPDLYKVELLQFVPLSRFYVSGDLCTMGGVITVDSDLAALFLNYSHIVVGDIAAADVADAVFVTVAAPVLTNELCLADGAVLPVGGAVGDPAGQGVLVGGVYQPCGGDIIRVFIA